ncbi:MAG: ATP-binding protein [Ignavibacteriae bacterium]|nr:ATP-binding protein [Ignavibacteriota bacterium]
MLKIRIFSFSYLYSGLPEDTSGNGGGFVFDCRFIYNPGRKPEFGNLTGNDLPVRDFLDNQEEMQIFLNNIYKIIDTAVENYISRNFSDLMVSFGCTGGQHRSVYSANKLNEHINQKYPGTETELIHYNL